MTQQQGPAMIEAQGLTKYFGEFAAIQDVTFQVRKGEVVAFLGPNGAGKSTTMKLLTGYLAPTAGVAKIAGHNMSNRPAGRRRPIGLSARERPAVSRHDAPQPAELLRRRAGA